MCSPKQVEAVLLRHHKIKVNLNKGGEDLPRVDNHPNNSTNE